MDGITDMEDGNKRLLNSGNLSEEMYKTTTKDQVLNERIRLGFIQRHINYQSYQSLRKPPNLKLTSFISPQPPTPLSATYPISQVNISLRHTDTILRGCSTFPSIMTDYTMSGKPQKTINSQLPYSTN